MIFLYKAFSMKTQEARISSSLKSLNSSQEEKAGDSGLKTPNASKPEKATENTSTKLDSSHPSLNGIKEPLVFKKLSSHSSSFIQNILFEDSCTGVAVIDLFIALKSIKENLELLSQSNEKISERMNFLNEETEIVWKEFIELVESMRIFLEKMNTDISTYNLEKLEEKFSSTSFNKSYEKMKNVDSKSKCACEECGRDIKDIYNSENKKFTCLGCLISTLKEKSLSQLPISPEAFLGSFLASILYWQRGPEKEGKPIGTNSSSLIFENVASNGNLNIRESTVQMICDICEVLNMSGAREKEKPPPKQTLPRPGTDPGNFNLKTPEGTKHEIGRSGATPKQKGLRFECGQSSKEVVENRGELTSEGDSEFEEALTCQLNHPHDSRTRPSVTCMGDLSKAPSGKKSVSTLTPNNNIMTSWVGKLSDEIKSKVKQRKFKRAKKRVKIFERKPELEPGKIPEMVQFSIAANPSAGVFDVTVVQYKNQRYLAKYPMKYKKQIQPGLVANSTPDPHFPPLIRHSIDEFLSEESMGCSVSESMETCSDFDEDDMGEFLEIYVEDKTKSKTQDSFPVPSSKCHLHGNLRSMELKMGKTHFIEMHRLYPVFFVQEFIRKIKRTEQNANLERENLSNESSEERIFSLNSEEKQQEKIVVEGDSSDLVIYIQLQIEDDSGSVPSRLVLDYEKSPLEAHTRENDSGLSTSSSENTIRLTNDAQKGESLFKVWRAEEANRIPELKATEKTIPKKPLVLVERKQEKVEEEEEEESSKDLEKNISDMSIEREIKDNILVVETKVMDRANVLVIKNIKQSASVWHHQIGKRYKTEIIRLKKLEVSKDIMESIKSSAGELRKALLLIHEIESDIVDAQIDSAISILPRLELELRRHLNTKIKGLETKETKNRISVDNFLSSFDFGQREDSIGGDSDESSEYRFNNLLKLLSNLEDAVKTSEHSNNKVELGYNESSKIYQLLHALTDSIRELEEGLNVTSLSQTLNFASRLHTAIKEYDSIVKKQPADYLAPQEKNRKKRKPRWSTTEEASVTQHLKNVRKKVFEMVEMEAVGMEERIERDFDRLDRLGSENDEALMFLETLLQKTQKRVSEFKSLKTKLKDMNSSLNNFYENFQKEMTDGTEENMEAKVPEKSLEESLERIVEKSLCINSESSQEKVSVRNSGKISSGTTLNRVSEKNIEIFPEEPLQEIFDKISEKSLKKDLENITEKTCDDNSEKIRVSVFEKNSERSLGTNSKRTPSCVSERRLEKTTAKTSVRIPSRVLGKSVERIFDKNLERNSSTSSKTTSNRVIERTPEKNSRKSFNKTPGKISNKSFKQNVETSQETNSERNMEKPFKRSLETIPWFPSEEEDQVKPPDKISKNSSERNEKRFVKKPSDGCFKTSESLRVPEKFLENTLAQPSGEISGGNVGRVVEKRSHEALNELTESSRKTPDVINEELAPEKNTEGEPITQESLEQIVSSFISAIDYLKLKSTTENKPEEKTSENPSTQSLGKAQKSGNSSTPDPLTSTIKEFKVIGQSSLYLSWTEPEGPLEGSINGYEIYVDGKLNQKVRNPQRLQAVLYSVDLSKKIQVQLYAVVENNPKALLASMHLNGE